MPRAYGCTEKKVTMEIIPERKVKHVFGIDFGATNSVISYVDENLKVQVCRSENGNMITPSVVDLSDEMTMVGQIAKDNKIFYPHSVFDFFKCEMCQGHAVKYYGENFDQETTAIDLSAEVLKYLAQYAEDATDSKVSVAVIAVPVYFCQDEKQATKEAAEKAGFEKIYLVEEPVATAVHYGYEGDKSETVLVYNLGGCTFDVTAVDIKDYNYDCIVTEGDQQLGGRNWSFYVQEIIRSKLLEAGIEERELSDEDISCIQNSAEKAKCTLTRETEVNVKLRLDVGRSQFNVTRHEFESKTRDLLDRTIDMTRSVKKKVEEQGKRITKILLSGGSTYMPQVRERLMSAFPDVYVEIPSEPNLAVSKGAAFYATILPIKWCPVLPCKKPETKSDKLTISFNNVKNVRKLSVRPIGSYEISEDDSMAITIKNEDDRIPTATDVSITLVSKGGSTKKMDVHIHKHMYKSSISTFKQNKGNLISSSAIHMEVGEGDLIKLTAIDPNGVAVELEATAESKSADKIL